MKNTANDIFKLIINVDDTQIINEEEIIEQLLKEIYDVGKLLENNMNKIIQSLKASIIS